MCDEDSSVMLNFKYRERIDISQGGRGCCRLRSDGLGAWRKVVTPRRPDIKKGDGAGAQVERENWMGDLSWIYIVVLNYKC